MMTWVSAAVALLELVTLVLREAQRQRDSAAATLNLAKELAAHAQVLIKTANDARAAADRAAADPAHVFDRDADSRD